MYSTKRVEKYLEMAKEASKNSDFPQHHLGAVIVYKGQPLAFACNSLKTSPVQKFYNREREDFDPEAEYENNNSLHAEIAALGKVKYLDIDFSKVSVFVYRAHKDGSHGLARPCSACQKCMRDMGIKDVYFTVDGESAFGYERLGM